MILVRMSTFVMLPRLLYVISHPAARALLGRSIICLYGLPSSIGKSAIL